MGIARILWDRNCDQAGLHRRGTMQSLASLRHSQQLVKQIGRAVQPMSRQEKGSGDQLPAPRKHFDSLLFRCDYCPVPLRDTVCGLPPPLSATDTVALRAPVAVGLKVTEIVHVP